MRIIFMGSAMLSCPSLEALLKGGDEIVAVVTQPDRPKGRNLGLAASPVKLLAELRGIRVLTPEKLNTAESVDILRSLRPDLMVVVAYGQILKPDVLRLPALGCLNMHPSLLPKYRGAAPIQWAIVNGDSVTGVTSMFMNERMDAGDIILQKDVQIAADETGGALNDRMAVEAAELLSKTVDIMRSGKVIRKPQAESGVTLAPKLAKKDGKIDWTESAGRIYNKIRAFNPWPCCYCQFGNKTLRVLKSRVEAVSGRPGEILDVSGDGLVVGAREGAIRLTEVQPEGRKAMSGADYLRGHMLKMGEILQ